MPHFFASEASKPKHSLYNGLKIISLILFITLACLSADTDQAFGLEEVKVPSPPSVITLPIVLCQDLTITNIDMTIAGYNTAMLELKDVTLAGGILEDSGYVIINNTAGDTVTLIIYAQEEIITGTGTIGFITFDIKAEDTATLSFTRFESSEVTVCGGFYVNDSVTQGVKISMNNPPEAAAVSLETDEDTPLDAKLNAADTDGDPLIYAIINEPDKGTAEITDPNTGAFTYTPNENETGTDSFTYQVSDGIFDSNIATVTVEITPLNDAPVFASPPILDAEEDETYTYSIITTDGDPEDGLIISAVALPEWLTLTDHGDRTATLEGIPSDADVGGHSVRLEVTDADGESDTQEFIIRVENINDAPEFTSEPVTQATEDEPYTYLITSTDTDLFDIRIVTAPELPAWLSIIYDEIADATLTGTPSDADVGEHPVELEVRDRDGETDTQSFTITVANTNDAPVFTSTPVTTATEDELYTYDIATADPDIGDTRIITALELPGWLELTDNGDGTATLSGTPNNSKVGTYDLTLEVKDAAETSAVQGFTLEVKNVNDAPVFSSEPVTEAAEDSLYTFEITTDDPDQDDIPLITATEELPEWLTLTDNEDGTAILTGTPGNNNVGEHPVELQAEDSSGVTGTLAFTIRVENINNAPVLDNTGEMALKPVIEDAEAMTNLGTLVSEIIAGTEEFPNPVSDADKDADAGIAVVAIENTGGIWQYDEDRNGIFSDFPEDIAENKAVLLNDTAMIRFLPEPDFSGTAAIYFRAWDRTRGQNGDIDADTTQNSGTTAFSIEIGTAVITVTPVNDAPIISGEPPTRGSQGNTYRFIPNAEDPDITDTLIFSIINQPEWASFSIFTGELSGTPNNSDIGTYSDIVISVSDGKEIVSLNIFDITIVNINDPPTISGEPPTTATQGFFYTFAPTAQDPDPDNPLTFSIENQPDWANFNSDTGELSGIPDNSHVGINSNIIISVSDGAEKVSLPAFDIQVINVNDVPAISGEPLTKINQGTAYRFVPTVEDPDIGDPLNFSITNQPDWADFNPETGELSGTPDDSHVGITRDIVISVSDGAGTVSLPAFDITVGDINEVPTISGTPPTLINKGTAYTFIPMAEDPDTRDILSFSITNQPDWADFDPETGELSGTPGNNHVGVTAGIVISVSDGLETVSLPAFDITVLDTLNNPPTISGGPLTTVNEDSDYRFAPAASDLDTGDILSFSITNKPEWAAFDTETGELSGTPDNSHVGITAGIVISVSDGLETVSLPPFDLAVINVNDAPVITGQRQLTIRPEDSLTLTLSDVSVSDPDNAFPDDFTLIVGTAQNYTRLDNEITPLEGFSGILTVPVLVNDGTADSEVFELKVAAFSADNMRTVSGTIFNLEKDKEIWVNVLSPSLEFSQVLNIKGTGLDTEYTVRELLPVSDYRVEISSEDYFYQVFDNQDDWEDADPVDLSENDASGIDFTINPPVAVVSGTIIFPEDAIPGETVRVNVMSRSKGSEADTQVVFEGDLEVPYEIAGLFHEDDYTASVWSNTYKDRYYDGTENGTKDENDAAPINTKAAEARAVNFKLERGIAVPGKISADTTEELYVEVWDSNGFSKTGVILEDGTLVVKGLEEDEVFYIVVSKPGEAPYFYSESGTVRDISLATRVRASEGIPEDIEITVTEGESISGTVLDENGQPLGGVWIDAVSESEQAGYGTFTLADGTYVIKGLPSGEDYTTEALPDWSSALASAEASGIESGTGDGSMVLISREAYTIEGSVEDEDGINISNIEVEIWSDSENFHGWSTPPTGVQDLHVVNPYRISGLPPADDYIIRAHPPANTPYAVFTRENISVREDTVFDIVLTSAAEVRGQIQTNDEEPVKGVKVILISKETGFRGEAVTDKDGFYEIPNVPEASDLEIITVSESHTSQEKLVELGGDIDIDIVFTLEPGSGISGKITDSNTGEPLSNALVEAYSENNPDTPNCSGIAQTDESGHYAIEGLKKEYEDGTSVNDYTVTVNAGEYPLHYESEKTPGEEAVNFLLEPGEPISGTATMPADSDIVVVEVFEKDGNFIKSVLSTNDGIFDTGGLSPDRQYQLKFTAFLENEATRSQWAGEGDIGFDDPDPASNKNPDAAKVYDAGDIADFRFGGTASPRTAEPGNRRSRSDAGESELKIDSVAEDIVSNQPQVTVKWESSSTNPDERYYYVFNQSADYKITKRSAPRTRPIHIRRVTSQELDGDNVAYYFHVAPVDQRGQIGLTYRLGFRIDTVPPSNALAVAPKYTVSPYISLMLGASGASEMYISNTNYGKGGKWEKWVKEKEWKISSGQGKKKIYVQFRDRAGNTANALAVTERVLSLPDQYQITAMAGDGGNISPSGEVAAYPDDEITFTVIPDREYDIDKVFVDGEPVSLTDGNTYTFRNVTQDAAIAVTFKEKPSSDYIITAVAGTHGDISPSYKVAVKGGDGAIFTIVPDPGYCVDTVEVDGKPMGFKDDNTFQFINVRKDYFLFVTFKENHEIHKKN